MQELISVLQPARRSSRNTKRITTKAAVIDAAVAAVVPSSHKLCSFLLPLVHLAHDTNSETSYRLHQIDRYYLPKDCKLADKDVNHIVPGMFNALSHVNVGPKLIQEVCTTVDIAQKIVAYVCHNHQRYAMNCGQSYLPITFKEDGKPYLSFLLPDDALTGEERRLLDFIANKVLDKMNIQPELTVEEFTYKNGKKDNLVQAMLDNTVTNIFIRSKP